jgi:hypothetical protein
MTLMKIDPLGNLDALYVFHADGFEHCVDRVFILEILVELTVAAQVVVGAGTEANASFEMMQARAPLGGKRL